MILTVTPFEFAAEYDPDGVTDGDSLRTIARGPTATVEGGRRAVVVAVMLSVTLALVLWKCRCVWFSDLRMMIVGWKDVNIDMMLHGRLPLLVKWESIPRIREDESVDHRRLEYASEEVIYCGIASELYDVTI
jgi:hypothetical protein